MHPTEIVSTGMAERYDGPIDRVPDYDPVRREHLWITPVLYGVNLEKLEAGEQLIFDSANLLMAGAIGCYHCEQPYSKRLTFRPCPGDSEA